jgi:hypothetical protein
MSIEQGAQCVLILLHYCTNLKRRKKNSIWMSISGNTFCPNFPFWRPLKDFVSDAVIYLETSNLADDLCS